MEKFILNLQFIFRPSYWAMNNPYNKEMDEIMEYLIDNFDFEDITQHTATLGGHEIWIENQPYATMVLRGYLSRCRASRLTIKKGIDKLQNSKKTLDKELIELKEKIKNGK